MHDITLTILNSWTCVVFEVGVHYIAVIISVAGDPLTK